VLCSDLDRVPNEGCPWAPEPGEEHRDTLHEAVRAAVDSALTDRQRCMVEGYFFEGLSQGDLARKLGVTQQVVQKTLFGVVRSGKRIGGALSRLRMALAPVMGSLSS
jgi:DNA-directed RNA polymerase specialized sigma24 family protein